MKRLITLVTVLILSSTPVSAETVRTCSSVYGGGEVCGEATTSVTVEHKTVAAGVNDLQLWQVIAGVAGIAFVSTLLYKLSYRWYILG
ncbi:MAG: hypothetical protein UX64_C0026G0001 [Microgenomates group bacterium GW2011_GWC2_46_7]|nr:MAG: hypothetical protein UX64_C0026G0001 [Microgenomates group bacterium GW2011_GWC2_46_7]